MNHIAFRTTPEIISDHHAFAALMLRRMVESHSCIGKTSDEEYASGIAYAARKYKLPTDGGTLNISSMSAGHIAYIADLVAEAVGQDRLSRGTMEIAVNDAELNAPNERKDETA